MERKWVVVATASPWDETPRIRKQVARALAQHYEVLYIHFPYEWRSKYTSRFGVAEPGITVWQSGNLLTLPEPILAGLPALSLPEKWLLKKSLKRRLKQMSIAPIAVVNFDQRHCWIQSQDLFPRAVYLCNDDYAGLVHRKRVAIQRKRQMLEAARDADTALAVSGHLARMLGVAHKAKVFYPGHDLPVPDSPPPQRGNTSNRIRVGYMGYMDKRLNLEWIRAAADQSDIEWHMIGPMSSPETRKALDSSKVRLYEPRTGERLLDWLIEMDVLTMPFDLPRHLAPSFARPNKTFYYLASSRPIVVADWPGYHDFEPGTVYRAGDAEQFIDQIRTAFREDGEQKAQRRLEIARENTWEKRILELCDYLEPNGTG